MIYKLIHKTKYEYSGRVNTYHGLACLKPLSNERQKCNAFEIIISPEPSELNTRIDYFGNTLHYFNINTAHKELIVEAKSHVESYFTDLSVLNLDISIADAGIPTFRHNEIAK